MFLPDKHALQAHVGHDLRLQNASGDRCSLTLHCVTCGSDLATADETLPAETLEELRSIARDNYQLEGSIEVDDDAPVSYEPDLAKCTGAYVQAWVWVDRDESTKWPEDGQKREDN